MSNTRLYLVAACIGGTAQAPRLIEAGTAAAARNHATKDMLTVKPATPKEVASLIGAGVRLEIAHEVPPEQLQIGEAPPPPAGGSPAPGGGYTFEGDGTTGGAGLGSTPKLPDTDLTEAVWPSGNAAGGPSDDNIVDAEVTAGATVIEPEGHVGAPRVRNRRRA